MVRESIVAALVYKYIKLVELGEICICWSADYLALSLWVHNLKIGRRN